MRINKTSLIVLVLATLSLISTISAQEVCPNIIGWKIVDDSCVSDTGCDYDFSGNTTYYSTEKMCLAILGGNYKYCEVDEDCKSLNGCDAGCWVTTYEPPDRTGGVCPTLLGPESCKCYQNECIPTCSVDSDCVEFYVGCEEGEILTCQNDLCLCQEECIEGETKDYTCLDGTKVSWCVCENNRFTCIISPETQCPSVTTTTTVTSITHEGDGTYVLNLGDSIKTSNGYLVELTAALGEFGSRSDWRTDINIYDPNGELIKNHISWGNGTIETDYINVEFERYEEGKATVTINSYDITTSTIPVEQPSKFETSILAICIIIIILIVILLKTKK